MPSLKTLAATLVVGLFATACNGETPSPTPVTQADVTTSAPTTTAAPSTTGARSTSASLPPTTDVRYLTDVRAAHQSNGDRVVFEFDGVTPPGYSVRYGTGFESEGGTVTAAGAKQLLVTFRAAAAVKLTGGVTPTYAGPATITPSDTTVVEQLKSAGGFESTLQWVVGTKTEAGFTVSTLTNPSRVIIDFSS